MSVSDAYREYVLEQLGAIGGVTWRRMFGGVGLYAGGAFFAVLDDDQVFFKVDDATRPAFVARGAQPWAPVPGAKPSRGYFELPADVLDDRDELAAWALRAVAVARSAAAPQARKAKTARPPAQRAARRTAARERMLKPARGIAGTGALVTPADILRPFPPAVRALAGRVRAVVKRAAPTLGEVPYPGWKAIGFRHEEAGYVCGVFPTREGVRLIFEHGAALDDPDGMLEGKGRVRQVRYVTMLKDADVRVRALTRLVRAALAHGLVRS
jgi:DNA transformation protein